MCRSRKLPDFPARRDKLEEFFDIQIEPGPNVYWRDEYFGLSTTVIKRTDIATEHASSIPLFRREKGPGGVDEGLIARSWVRVSPDNDDENLEPREIINLTLRQANVITAEDLYQASEAKRQLLQLGEARVDKALRELCARRLVSHVNKNRPTPGRNYDITETFLNGMKTDLDVTHYAKAAAYKVRLDEAFQAGLPFTVPYHANDGEVMAVMNLLAYGRVRLIPVNPPLNRFGLTDGDYRTRFMDRSRLHFEVEVQRTDTYMFGLDPLGHLPPIPSYSHIDVDIDDDPQQEPKQKPIPIWYDIHGNLVTVMWYKVLAAVLTLLATRSAATLHELSRYLKRSLDVYELTLVLHWLIEAGAVKEVDIGGGRGGRRRDGDSDGDGDVDGWVLLEWWWLLIPPLATTSYY